MFKVKIIAVGKVKEDYIRQGIEEYSKRLKAFCSVEMTEIKEEVGDDMHNLKAEAENILPKMGLNAYALAIEGEKLSSEKFAATVKKAIDSGSELTFIIGSSNGLDDKVKQAAKGKISFSDMTFPHTLARLILFEQLYRAFTIINGKAYHK
ncbi:MAG: 23S rRNA (pseudouridine(1915)-N(3))-methyltransferase RlmH [Clostridia bacterium]|nr:23S rRNA (pseudouridine(1915)-N(3))-methyltransferase RlmH [Clostridia bacterium]